MLTRVVRALRDAPYVNADIGFRMARAAAIGVALSVAVLFAGAQGGTDHNGTAAGGDFVAYWISAGLAWAGHAADAYRPELMLAAEHRSITMPADAFLPFYYPPVWLVLLLPFAALPYLAAWLTFCAASALPFVLALRRLLPKVPGMWLAILGFPGLLVNAGNGQNGFVTAACFAGYAVWLDRRPLLAGMALGVLCYKPQFALAVPFALLAARRVRPIAGAVGSGAALGLASLALFGIAPWRAFVGAFPVARQMFEHGLIYPFKVVSVLGGLHLLGIGGAAAYAAQLLVAGAVLLVLAAVSWRRPGGAIEAGVLAAAALLVTPYATDYDLATATVAMAAIFTAAQRTGFLPWEKMLLLLAYVLPLLGPAIARGTHLAIAPMVLVGLFAMAVRRAWVRKEAVLF